MTTPGVAVMLLGWVVTRGDASGVGRDDAQLFEHASQPGATPPIDGRVSPRLRDMLYRCFDGATRERPSARELLDDEPFLRPPAHDDEDDTDEDDEEEEEVDDEAEAAGGDRADAAATSAAAANRSQRSTAAAAAAAGGGKGETADGPADMDMDKAGSSSSSSSSKALLARESGGAGDGARTAAAAKQRSSSSAQRHNEVLRSWHASSSGKDIAS